MKKVILLPILFLLLFASDSFAAKRYWIASAAAYWNNTANWSSTSGGAGGSSVPGSSDTAYFDGNGLGNDTLNANISVKYLNVAAGYTGKIVQSTYTISIGTTGAVMSGGTFEGGSGAITCGSLTISGCSYTSTSATHTGYYFNLSSGSFAHNNGRIKLNGTGSVIGSVTMYDLEFAPVASSTFTIASGTTITVDNNLYYSGTAIMALNTGTIDVKRDLYQANTGGHTTGGTATIRMIGTTKQTIYGHGTYNGPLPNVVINKSDTLALSSGVVIGGDFTYTAGVVSAGTSTVVFKDGVSKTISGSIDLYNVTFYYWVNNSTYTIASGTAITVNGTLTYSGDNTLSLNTGTINAKGNFLISNTDVSGGGGTATIVFNGSGTQTLTGPTTAGAGRLCGIHINKSASDTLKLINTITVVGNWTYSAGVINSDSSTVRFFGTKTITGSHTLYDVTLTGGTSVALNIASGTVLTVSHTLTTSSTYAISINVGTIDAKGNVTISNTGAGAGSGTLRINGTGDQTITGAGADLQGILPNVEINKASGTLSLVNHISVSGNWTYVAGTIDAGTSTVFFTSSLTVTGTHTLANVTFSGYSAANFGIASGTSLTVEGTFTVSGSNFVTLNVGTIYARGNISFSNTSASTGGTAAIIIDGTGNQSLTGSGTAGVGKLPQITINKSSGILSLASVISVTGSWIYTQGDVDPATSTVVLYGTSNLDGQAAGTSTCMRFYNLTVGGNTRTLTGNLDVNGNLTISSGTTLSAAAYTINVGGNWNSQGTWTYSTSTVVFDGSSYNTIKGASGTTVNFANVTLNRGAGSVTLQNPMKVNTAMTLTKGRIKTTSTYYLEFADNATCVASNDSAYVHGPVRKTGNDAFTFPLGDTTLHDSVAYHPLAITAPGSASDRFEAQYFGFGQTAGDSLVDTLGNVSSCEYWKIEELFGTSNVYVKVYWNQYSCSTENYDDLRLGGWDGNKWIDLGVSEFVPGAPLGSLRTAGPVSFSTQSVWNVAMVQRPNNSPYAILKKKLDAGYYQCSNGKLMFRFDDEYNDPDSKLSFRIFNDAYGQVTNDQLITAGYVPNVYYGSNYYLLNILDCNVVPNGNALNGFFILEVINEKNEHWFLRFKHTTSLNPNCTGGGVSTE